METTGAKLQKDLGLEFFLYTRYRLYILSYFTIMVIYYDSHRPELPLTLKHINDTKVVNLFRFGSNKAPIVSPLKNLSSFNGNLTNKIVLAVDLAGSFLVDRSLLSLIGEDGNRVVENLREVEQVENEPSTVKSNLGKGTTDFPPSPSFYLHSKGIGRLVKFYEFLGLTSLTKNAGMSDFTKKFKSERGMIMGHENTVAKLKKCKVYKKKDMVEFYWVTKATDKYDRDHRFKKGVPDNFALASNPRKEYVVGLRVLDFFKWMDTYDKTIPITIKDLKDILKVANVQVFSTDPSWHWQGMNWNCTQLDASMYPTTIAPRRWNKKDLHGDGNAFLSKHMQGIFNQLGFWLNLMSSMLNKELKG